MPEREKTDYNTSRFRNRRQERPAMTTIRKTITLTDAQNKWIKTQIDSGAYTNDSELVRDLIRRAQIENAELDSIRAALILGEESGVSLRQPNDIRSVVKLRKAASG